MTHSKLSQKWVIVLVFLPYQTAFESSSLPLHMLMLRLAAVPQSIQLLDFAFSTSAKWMFAARYGSNL